MQVNREKIEKIKYQAKDIVVPAGTPANSAIEESIDLDRYYHECTGVVAYEKADGGDPNYDLGLSDDVRTYHHLTHKKDWTPGDGVSLNERYKAITVPVTGQSLDVRVRPSLNLASELKIQVVFRLVRYEEIKAEIL